MSSSADSVIPPSMAVDARTAAFWACDSTDRPPLHITANDPDADRPTWTGPDLPRKQRDLDSNWQRFLVRHAAATVRHYAEAVPCYQVSWGSMLVTLAVLAGGDYEYHESAWMCPIDDLYDKPLPSFNPDSPKARQLTACFDAIKDELGGEHLIVPPLLTDGFTTLSSFRGADILAMDLIEQPEQVERWAEALTTMFIDIYEYYYQRLGYGRDVCFGGPVAPGRSEAVQCDFAVMLSPAMYEQFVLGGIRRMSDYFDYTLYHMDGVEQMRFLDLLQTCPGLNGIQWNPQVEFADPLSRLDDLKEIRRRGLCLMVNCQTIEQALRLTDALGPDGLFIRLQRFGGPEQAQEALTRAARWGMDPSENDK